MANSSPTPGIDKPLEDFLYTYTPDPHFRTGNKCYTSLGVKSHGSITFPDNRSSVADFIRVPANASVLGVKQLLNEQWGHERPSLVISLTGGAKDFNMKPSMLNAFRRGLLKVARTTGAWVITGGMNTGIMKLVGETIQMNPDRTRPIRLIGIATWGCVCGSKQLDVHGANVKYKKPKTVERGEAVLEPNHTHFIFVDDGSVRDYGGEIEFRASLEQAISGDRFATRAATQAEEVSSTSHGSFSQQEPDSVPVVLLVVEGGIRTVQTVYAAVVKNSIPAVFFEGTGRCCDLFAKAVHLYQHYQQTMQSMEDIAGPDRQNATRLSNRIKTKLRDALEKEILEICGINDRATSKTSAPNARPRRNSVSVVDPNDCFNWIYECVSTRSNYLNVVTMSSQKSSPPEIDRVILEALLKAASDPNSAPNGDSSRDKQFQLALEWNRADIVKSHIMVNERDWQKPGSKDMFIRALRRDQIEFVKLFLDHDFSLMDVFDNTNILRSLYDDINIGLTNPIDTTKGSLRSMYRQFLNLFVGDLYELDVSRCFGDTSRKPDDDDNEGSGRNLAGRIDVDKELFLWSLLKDRRESILLFWSRLKNKICAALIATLIYRKRARTDNDRTYLKAANEFEQLAVQILNKFYQSNPRTCTEAIIRQIPSYGNITWLQLAVAADAKEFVAQRAVQDVLNNIWFGCIHLSVSEKQIIFGTVCIFYSGFLRFDDKLVVSKDPTYVFEDKLVKPRTLNTQLSVTNRRLDRPADAVMMKLLPDDNHNDQNRTRSEKIKREDVLRYLSNILTFIRAPYVKYLYHVYFHVIFLLLFSYVILCDFFPLYDFETDACASPKDDNKRREPQDSDIVVINPRDKTTRIVPYGFQRRDRPATTEIILAIWVFSLLCEEIRQLFSSEARSFRKALAIYFEVFWNKLDVLALIIFCIGFTLRFIPSSECFCAARIALSIDLTIWFIRSMDFFAALKRLGPKLVMIGEMINDLKFFMLMLTVFILGFGISSHSLVHGTQEFSWHLPREIINRAYWEIFGDLNSLDTFEDNYQPNGYAVFALTAVYMSMVSILLVNLLIAMFSNTFDRLQTDTDRIWKFQRYSLICEYLTRPALPPPLIFFSHLWRVALWTLSHCVKSSCIEKVTEKHNNRTRYKTTLDNKSSNIIEMAEDAFGDEVYDTFMKANRAHVGEHDFDELRDRSSRTPVPDRVQTLENRIQTFQYQQAHMIEYLDCLMEGLQKMSDKELRVPDRSRFEIGQPTDDPVDTPDQPPRMHGGATAAGDDRVTTTELDTPPATSTHLSVPRIA